MWRPGQGFEVEPAREREGICQRRPAVMDPTQKLAGLALRDSPRAARQLTPELRPHLFSSPEPRTRLPPHTAAPAHGCPHSAAPAHGCPPPAPGSPHSAALARVAPRPRAAPGRDPPRWDPFPVKVSRRGGHRPGNESRLLPRRRQSPCFRSPGALLGEASWAGCHGRSPAPTHPAELSVRC